MITTKREIQLSSGTVCTVICHRPEIGVDVTQEEYDRRMRNIGEKAYNLYYKECDKLVKAGESDKAERLWKAVFPQLEPFWN